MANAVPEVPAGSRTPRGESGKRRRVALLIEVAPESAQDLADELNALAPSIAAQFAGSVVARSTVLNNVMGGFVEMAMVDALGDSDGRLSAMSITAGDWVMVEEEVGHAIRQVTEVEPGEFADGPFFCLDGRDGRLHWSALKQPANERQAALWALQPGDRLAYWCKRRLDKLGRHRRSPWHPKGFKCTGRGEWHIATITDVERTATYDEQCLPAFHVEGQLGHPNDAAWQITPFVDDLPEGGPMEREAVGAMGGR